MRHLEKEVTIYDIARKLNLSAATVSRGLKNNPAINQTTRKKIAAAADEMGYRFNSFASNLRRQRTDTIGVIVPRLNSNFMSEALAGMEKAASEAGYNLIISQSHESMIKERKNAATMFNSRVDGLLVSLSYDTTSMEHFAPFIKKGIPLLFFDRASGYKNSPSIIIDNFKAAYEIVSHLIGEGCSNIVHITGNQSRDIYKKRFEGYKRALEDHTIPFRDDLVFINNLSRQEGAAAAEEILKRPQLPDGIFAANDVCAISCMQTLKQNGIKIPADIAIAGFNNDYISTVAEPNLTTINYPAFELGEAAAKTLIQQLTNSSDLENENALILKHQLIVRESTRKRQ